MATSKKKKKSSIGVLFWMAFILLILVVFLVSRPQIQRVVQSTGLVDVIKDRFGNKDTTDKKDLVFGTDTPSAPANGGDGSEDVQVKPDTGPAPVTSPERTTGGSPNSTGATGTTTTQPTSPATTTTQRPAPEQTAPRQTTPQTTQPTQQQPAPKEEPAAPAVAYHTREARIYYTRVTDNGSTLPEAVTRVVKYVDSPLTETIKSLLRGPTAEELNRGLLNLIPEGTSLISAYVQNGIAYLNFNDSFAFNPMGVEGFLAQLKQIVHTATEFSTVSRVQFMIDGKKLQYLGGEGIYVGQPLGRDSFS